MKVAYPEFQYYLNANNPSQVTILDGDSNPYPVSDYDSVKLVHKSGYDKDTEIQELAFTQSGASSHIISWTPTATELAKFSGKTSNIIEVQLIDNSETLPDIYASIQIQLKTGFVGDVTNQSGTISIDGSNNITFEITSGKVTSPEVAGVLSNATTKTPVDTDIFTGVTSAGALFGSAWSTIKTDLASTVQTLTNKTITSPIETINALGSISGANEIDASAGSIVTATLTGTTTLTFSGEPGSGERSFVLKFSGAQTINWPANTIFAGGAAPSITGPDYEIPCSIDSSGIVTVHGIIDEYATV